MTLAQVSELQSFRAQLPHVENQCPPQIPPRQRPTCKVHRQRLSGAARKNRSPWLGPGTKRPVKCSSHQVSVDTCGLAPMFPRPAQRHTLVGQGVFDTSGSAGLLSPGWSTQLLRAWAHPRQLAARCPLARRFHLSVLQGAPSRRISLLVTCAHRHQWHSSQTR